MADKQHGKLSTYGGGCRCNWCREASKTYQRERRDRLKNGGGTRPQERRMTKVVVLSSGMLSLSISANLLDLTQPERGMIEIIVNAMNEHETKRAETA